MRQAAVLFLFVVAGLGVAAPVLADTPAKEVSPPTPISVAGKAGIPVVAVTRVGNTIADQERLGDLQRGWFCSTAGNFRWDSKVAAMLEQQIKALVPKELESAGYRIQKKSESAFDIDSAGQKPDFELGAVVKAFALNLCVGDGGSLKGSSFIDIKWELLNAKSQKVVLSLATSGNFVRDSGESETIPEFVRHAIAVSARGLLAKKDFVAAVMDADASAQPAPSAAFEFTNAQPAPGGTQQNSTQIRAAVVTIETSAGSGSGFYIDRQGYLLTAQHVVGEARFAKVRTATGREIPAEVLHADVRRDVALLKTAATPFDPLPVRLGETHVGEEVYSVGSPLGDTFNGSITKGVLSGDRDLEHMRFLQSDVAVLPGNSGGPLLDSTGSVIGITAQALDQGRANLNLFVPINEALDALSVKMH